MSLKVLLYLNIIILVISCLFDFINKSIISTNLKLLLICTLIIIHLLKQKENFSIFINNDTNKIKDNGGLFYDGLENLNKEKLRRINSKDKLSMFSFNKCSSECCPSRYTCDRGCICMTEEQKKLINTRGIGTFYDDYPLI